MKMYYDKNIKDYICCGDKDIISVTEVKPLEDYKLWLKFSNGKEKIFNFKPLLGYSCFKPLTDKNTFNSVYVDYGTTVWNNGEIDIAPESLYEDSLPLSKGNVV